MDRTAQIAPLQRVVSLVVPQSTRAATPLRDFAPAPPQPQSSSTPLRSSAAATMEEQQFQTSVDVSVSNMQRDGVDVPDPLTLGTAMMLTYA